MTQDEFNDEMFMMQRRLINWDIDRVRDNMRPYANLWHTDMVDAGGRYRVAPSNCPENYGFNAIALEVPAPGKKVTVDFKGRGRPQGLQQRQCGEGRMALRTCGRGC